MRFEANWLSDGLKRRSEDIFLGGFSINFIVNLLSQSFRFTRLAKYYSWSMGSIAPYNGFILE